MTGSGGTRGWDGTLGDIEEVHTDLLVIGSGFAGLWAAVTARRHGVERVALIDKADVARSSQSRMSAGATVYLLPGDDLDAWVCDVAETQSWLCHQDMVEEMLATSYRRLRQLEEWGVAYARAGAEDYVRLPSRGFEKLQMLVLPTYRNRTGGRAVTTVLREQVVRSRCRLLPRLFVTDLLLGDGQVCGALAFDRTTARPHLLRAGAVVLAAGDCSFRGHYACVDSATGDGFALALGAGARLSNMEFLVVNTGPPTFGFEGTGIATRFGGTFRNAEGESFMAAYHADGDSAEVAYLADAMALEAEQGRAPFTLDLRAAAEENSFLRIAFARMGGFMPTTLERLSGAGVDVFAEPQLFEPAIQTLRGGVRTDALGVTDVPGLFAAGTAQAFDPGLFNGWSSMRAMWSGEVAGESAGTFLDETRGTGRARSADGPPGHLSGLPPDRSEVLDRARRALAPLGPGTRERPRVRDVLESLQQALFARGVCLRKRLETMSAALEAVGALPHDAGSIEAGDPHELVKAHETANMVLAAELFLRSSISRTESRGDHQRADHPNTDNDNWLRWINASLSDSNGGMGQPSGLMATTEPVPLDRYPHRPEWLLPQDPRGQPSPLSGDPVPLDGFPNRQDLPAGEPTAPVQPIADERGAR